MLGLMTAAAGCGSDAASDADAALDTATSDASDADELPDVASDADDADDVADVAPDTADSALDTAAPADAVRVVSLNLRCLIDDWAARKPVIVAALAALDPDVMGFQEVCAEAGVQDALPELIEALTAQTGRSYAVHRGVTHRAWDTYDEGIAVVSAWPITETATKNLPTGVFPRKALLARLTRPDGGTLVFTTTHLDHQSDLTRKQQAEAVAAAIAEFAEDGEAALLTGDFNEPASGGAVYLVLSNAGLADMWATLHPGDAGPTFPASNPSDRIDYIWLEASGTSFAGRSMARILWTGGVDGSDHLGLTATIAW
ncbi:MAG: hypothetical protein CVU56_07665 [Deltaproteobacteria bacterium HGW-Deltaproteobacteria-14]|nr:MAG: hypothetical protein CVU56_07665 [Deltaproteobacteria bacterium HGW-Deltaproteobacteria-14]